MKTCCEPMCANGFEFTTKPHSFGKKDLQPFGITRSPGIIIQHLNSMGTNPFNSTTGIQNFALISPIKIIDVYLKYQSCIPGDIPGD
jgi:hypothetical protein